MKTLFFSLAVVALCLLSTTSCKSNQAEEAARQDSLKTAKSDTQKNTSPYSEYIITPPNPDYTGDYVDKYSNGIIKFSGFFRFGQRHGQWMAFYENGIKWSECFYDNGKRHGASTVYYPDGKIQYTGWFKNDQRDSLWFFYDNTGKEVDRRAYRNGEETGLVN